MDGKFSCSPFIVEYYKYYEYPALSMHLRSLKNMQLNLGISRYSLECGNPFISRKMITYQCSPQLEIWWWLS